MKRGFVEAGLHVVPLDGRREQWRGNCCSGNGLVFRLSVHCVVNKRTMSTRTMKLFIFYFFLLYFSMHYNILFAICHCPTSWINRLMITEYVLFVV